MDEITVRKDELLKVLKKNRGDHRDAFEKALDGWFETAKAEIERLRDEAKKGKLKQVHLVLPRPEDHTVDYDRAIQMLEMDIEETVVLRVDEFAQYVQDDWGWKRSWTVSNSGYMAASSK